MITGDLSYDQLNAAMKDIDIVFHFAAMKSPISKKAMRIPTLAFRQIFWAPQMCLRLLKIIRLVSFFMPQPCMSTVTRGFYRATKQATETVLKAYSERYNLPFTILRYGSLYGPRSQSWNGLNRYITEIIETGRIEYKGNGQERREYIHIVDAARMTARAIDPKFDNKSLLITGQQSLASKQILELIFEILGKEQDILYNNDDLDKSHYRLTPYRYQPDLAVKLNPDHFIDFGQGIIELIENINSSDDDNS